VSFSYEPLSERKVSAYEGCFSLPDLAGLVPRFYSVVVSGYDLEGNKLEEVSELGWYWESGSVGLRSLRL